MRTNLPAPPPKSSLVRNPRGRPSKKNPQTVGKLLAAFQHGYTVEEACVYAQINRSTFYDWLSDDPDFSDKIEGAKYHIGMMARETLFEAIANKKWMAAAWYLERKFPEEFALRQKVDLKSTVTNVTLTSAQWDALIEVNNATQDVIDGTATNTGTGSNPGDPKRALPAGGGTSQDKKS